MFMSHKRLNSIIRRWYDPSPREENKVSKGHPLKIFDEKEQNAMGW